MMNRFLATTNKSLPRAIGVAYSTTSPLAVPSSRELAEEFGESHFRPYGPLRTKSTAEAIRFRPPPLYREASFAEYAGGSGPSGDHTMPHYGRFFSSAVVSCGAFTAPSGSKRKTESHVQDQVMSICDSLPYPASQMYGGTQPPKLQRRASFAGELADVASGADEHANIDKTLGSFLYADLHDIMPKLVRRSSFAGEVDDVEQALEKFDLVAKKGKAPVLAWQPWRHLQAKPRNVQQRAASSSASFSSTARIKNGTTVITTTTTTTISSEDPYDDGEGFGWGTPRCPVP